MKRKVFVLKEVYIKIEGRVQGVGYRYWAVSMAKHIGNISGWVRNEDDGSVEILMSGEDDNINQFINLCYKGPMFARVDSIKYLSGVSNYFLPQIIEGKFVAI